MSIFNLDPTASENLSALAEQNGINVENEELQPAWYSPENIKTQALRYGVSYLQGGIEGAEALKQGAKRGLYRAQYAEIVSDEELKKQTLQKMEAAKIPETANIGAQIIYGLADPLTMFAVNTSMNLETLAAPPLRVIEAAEVYKKSQTALHEAEGMDRNTAENVSLIESAGLAAGFMLPASLPGNLTTRVLTGAGIQASAGALERGAVSSTLRDAGYTEMADQYKAFDAKSLTIDLALGGLFGAIHIPEVRPSDLDPILTANNSKHAEVDVAPGVPADLETVQAHADMIKSSVESLMNDTEIVATDKVANGNFVENPNRQVFNDEVKSVIDEHLGEEFSVLRQELEKRGLPTDMEFYSIDNQGPVRFTDRVRALATELDTEKLQQKITALKNDLEDRTARQQAKKDEDLVRGELWVRERLLRAERQKEITPEQHSLAKWLLDQNPNIANDLAISFRASEGAAAGQYNPVEKLMTLFKNRGDDMTAAHEILHHSERMMPEALRSKIHGAWIDSLQSLHDMAQDIGDQKLLGNIDLAIRAAAGDQDAYSKLSTAIGSGELPKSFYQYINPSEYWAVNASRLVQERAGADSWVKQAVQWMKDFLEHVKKTFGLDNQSAIIKGLNSVLEAKGEMTGRMIASMQDYFDIGPKDDAGRVAEMLRKSAENENKVGVTVGARPGEFGWSFTERDKTPPPIQHPVQRSPRLEKIGAAVQEIFAGRQFKTLVKDLTGASDIKVNQIEGTWLGNQEPSFVIQGKNLTDEAATKLAKTLGFLFAQDSTIKTTHSPDFAEGIPTLYIGSPDMLQKEQLNVIIEQARKHGLDLSTTTDKKAVRFMHFGDESELVTFTKSVISIAEEAGLESPITVRTQGELYEASEYLIGQVREDGTRVGLLGSEQDRSAVLGRLFDTVLVPYAKAIAGEGYRFSADRFAERFGLTEAERETLRTKLMPKEGLSRSTVPLMEGTEKLDIVPTVERTKTELVLAPDQVEGKRTKKIPQKTTYYVPNVTDIMWALQNRAASKGMIEPGDYSPKAMKVISETIADEVIYHMQHSAKSAIGWYDTALKKAKSMYKEIFPEITTNKDNGMLFDAILGITSQGNDVHSNSIFAARVYQLVKDKQMTLTEAVKSLKGSFGNQTVAIENNLLKLEHLINVNGYDKMRKLFNETKTVGEWNAILRKDKDLFGPNGKPLKAEGGAEQKVTGWMVFGPKIGSFINNLHGDYSTLTADLWFTRTWNRILGYMFQHSPLKEAKQYQEFKDALLAEYYQSKDAKTENGNPLTDKNGKPVPWENGKDVIGMSKDDFDKLLNDPDMLLQLANQLEASYRKGGYKQKSDLRRRAKNWVEGREEPEAAPRTDRERTFQQATAEAAQKLIQKKTGNLVEIADIQAALWFHEKELFQKLGVSDKKSAPADYADAAKNALDMYRSGQLYYVAAEGKYVGGDYGQYLGISVPDETGNTVEATKAIEQADTEVAKAKQDSQGFDAAVACALRG